MTIAITTRIDEETQQKLEQLAKATQRSRSWLVAEAVKKYIEDEVWQIAAIQEGIKQADEGKFASDEVVTAFFNKWGVDAK